MDSGEVRITPDSRVHAVASDILLRDSATSRLIFRPELVTNPHDRDACIKGTFIYQRRATGDRWEDMPPESLASLKKGEGYKLELHASETWALLKNLGALVRHYREAGIPPSQIKLMKLEGRIAQLLTLSRADLNSLLANHEEDALKIVSRVLSWVASNSSATSLFSSSTPLPELSAALGVASLREAVMFWEENQRNPSEEFWQQALEKRAFLLAQVFHYPLMILRGKAYVGGKRLDNQHGNIADIVGKIKSTGGALLIELKTPMTDLLGKQYRQDVFPCSPELNGAISQVLHYRSGLQREILALREELDPELHAEEPRCAVIAGSVFRELTSPAKRKSFERMRERLMSVSVIGYDELFSRARALLDLLSHDAPK